jgi:hypothetical protein
MLRRQRQQVVGPGSSSEGTTSSALFPFADNMKEPARRTQNPGVATLAREWRTILTAGSRRDTGGDCEQGQIYA